MKNTLLSLLAGFLIIGCDTSISSPMENAQTGEKVTFSTESLPGDDIQKQAEQGNADAQYKLAALLLSKGRVDEGIAWLSRSAALGHFQSEFELGKIYTRSYLKSVPQNDQEVFQWFKNAADQGYAPAQNNLGWMLFKERQISDATSWFKKAAVQGHAMAQLNLGKIYLDQNKPHEASQWFTKSAEQGIAVAQHGLGMTYLNYEPKNTEAAMIWIGKAAQQGYAPAQFDLGLLNAMGKNTPRDVVIASVLLSLAASHNDTDFKQVALNSKEKVEQQMNPTQISEANLLLNNWKVGTPLPTASKTGRMTQ